MDWGQILLIAFLGWAVISFTLGAVISIFAQVYHHISVNYWTKDQSLWDVIKKSATLNKKG